VDNVALLLSTNLLPDSEGRRKDAFEFDEQIEKLVPAFAAHNLRLETVVWEESLDRAGDYALMMPLMVWDYADGKHEQFLDTMQQLAAQTRVLNTCEMLKWNLDKSYLERLSNRGAPVLPSISVETVTAACIDRSFEELKTDHIVIKPRIGAGAWRQVSLKLGDALPDASTLPPAAALIQRFENNVQTEGEYSLIYFDGEFSHALIKRPKAGDYRIQSLYGGTEERVKPTAEQFEVCRRVLKTLDTTPLYARLDLLRGHDGDFKLIELELIEPYLYLAHASGDGGENEGAQMLAAAVGRRLNSA